MSKPTLLIKGKLKAANGDPNLQQALDEFVPIEYIINWFKDRLNKTGIANRVLVLKSETASGKSTLFPAELFKAMIRGGGNIPGIICTQPRVVTAITNVIGILDHYGKILRLGDTIGWSTKNNKVRLNSSGLLSATIGTLAQLLSTMTDEEILAEYKYILIDETHERDLQTDMTIYMLKNLIFRNKDNPACPFVVLMSATFEPEPFLKYFSPTPNEVNIMNNFIYCTGEPAGFDKMWTWNEGRTISNYPRSAADVVAQIVKNGADDGINGDVLIFMPGKQEFNQTTGWLEKLNESLAEAGGEGVFSIMQFDSMTVQTKNEDYMKIFYYPVAKQRVEIEGREYIPARRVIISTNVAETGLTLNNLKYVIDAGYNREIEYNPIYGIRALITKPAPHARIRQRMGRAGRKFKGVFYPLYPEYIYDRLPNLQLPQILTQNIDPIILSIIKEQIKVKTLAKKEPLFAIEDIDMIDAPTPDAIASSMEKLYALGFITPEGTKLTAIGELAARLPMIPLECVRMILSGYFWNSSILDLITISAWLILDSPTFAVPSTMEKGVLTHHKIGWFGIYKIGMPGFMTARGLLYKIRLLLADEFINGVALYNAITYVIVGAGPKNAMNALQRWCILNNISYNGCLEFLKLREELIEQFISAGFDVFSQEEQSLSRSDEASFMNTITKLKYCIYDGYRLNTLTLDDSNANYKTRNGLVIKNPVLFRKDELETPAIQINYDFVLKARPRVLLYNELSLKFNQKTNIHEVVAGKISALDGYISWDSDALI